MTADELVSLIRSHGWTDEQFQAVWDAAHPPTEFTYYDWQEMWDYVSPILSGGTIMAHSLEPGFAQFAKDHNLKPLSDEFYVASDQVSFAMTDGGLMVYTKDDNTVRLLPKA